MASHRLRRNELRAVDSPGSVRSCRASSISLVAETCLFCLVLAAGNVHLLGGALPAAPVLRAWIDPGNWIFLPDRVAEGE